MANQLYSAAREGYLTASASWTAQALGMVLVNSQYEFDVAHLTVADIPVLSRVGSSTMAGATATDGFADAAGAEFSDLAYIRPITQIVLIDVDGSDYELSKLIAFYDMVDGLPTSGARNIFVAPDQMFGGYFRL
jgi:hypothetical protein